MQYPFEVEPSKLWNCSNGRWVDISNTYANLFFRVNGNSSIFGEVQKENVPKIEKVKYNYCKWSDNNCFSDQSEYTFQEGWSHTVSTGYVFSSTLTDAVKNQFFSTGGEVRPRNMAIRIWKCSKSF